ncbi:hypothetical protein ACHAWF_006542 [Thalassiosira exigua]
MSHTNDRRYFYKERVNHLFSTANKSKHSLKHLIRQIRSDDFLWFVGLSEIKAPTVVTDPHIFESDKHQRFVEECVKCSAEEECYDVRVVFHGTAEINIQSILRDGLDPSLRRGQTYGQGEYFANNPAMSLHYCKGGKKMVVFAVITAKADVRAKDLIVVNKSERQLPLAALSFEGYSSSALSLSCAFQDQVTELWKEMKEKEKVAEEAQRKQKIIGLIVKTEYLAASDIYKMACAANARTPPEAWANEVATYVRDHIRDDETVDLYFPNLPPRPAQSKDLSILNSDQCETEAQEARSKCETLAIRT